MFTEATNRKRIVCVLRELGIKLFPPLEEIIEILRHQEEHVLANWLDAQESENAHVLLELHWNNPT